MRSSSRSLLGLVVSSCHERANALGRLLATCDCDVHFHLDSSQFKLPAQLDEVSIVVVDIDSQERALRYISQLRTTCPEGLAIMVSAETASSAARATFLDAGADDVVSSHCEPQEIMARIRRLERTSLSARPRPLLLRAGPICIDLNSQSVSVEEHPVYLTPTEYALLVRLIDRAGQLISHREIVEQILQAQDRIETSKVRYHVANLRRKLGPAGALIETVRPRGHRLRQSSEEPSLQER